MITLENGAVNFAEQSRIQPLDQQIVGGLALAGSLHESDFQEVAERLNDAFTALRSDATNQFGSCIAYAFRLGYQDECRLDGQLAETALRQNHGMQTLTKMVITEAQPKGEPATSTLWLGVDGDRFFQIHKHSGQIAMTDGELPHGLVYSLLGHK
jgi:hypothetical protein